MDDKPSMIDILKKSIQEGSTKEEEYLISNIKCICCNKDINGKPWITISLPNDNDKGNDNVSACGYMCGKNLKYYIGSGYWNNVVNKEDFNEPRPVINSNLYCKDITANFGIDEIRDEIKKEEEMITMIEEEYYDDIDNQFIDEYEYYENY